MLEGLAIQVDQNFRIISDAYPYIASRLLTDPSKELKAALHASRGTSANLKHELDEANAKLKKMQGGRTRSSPPSHTIHSGGTSRSQSAEAGDRYPIFAEYAGLDGHATRPDFTAMFGGVAMRGRTSTMTETARPKAKAARVKRE